MKVVSTKVEGDVVHMNIKWDPNDFSQTTAHYTDDAYEALKSALFWRTAAIENDNLEVEAIKLLFVAQGQEFTDRDGTLMKLLYGNVELQDGVYTLEAVCDWLLAKKAWTDEETISFVLEHGGQL